MIHIDYNEIEFSVTRSQGPGGQHVNRTNSCVQLRFSILASLSLNDEQKQKLLHRLAHRLAQGEFILIRVESERDQKSNKDKSVKMLNDLINLTLHDPKKRKPTKPTKSSQRKRLETKKTRSDVKKMRSEKIKY
jgi:ribosome-associated protein